MTGPIVRCLLVTLILSGSLQGRAEAQQSRRGGVLVSPEVGFRFGRDFSVDKWSIGGHVRVPLAGTLDLRPSGDVDLGMDRFGDDFQLNGDIALRGARDLAYLGGGVAYVHRRFDAGKTSGTGINLFLGFKPLPRPGAQLYLEGRWTRVDGESIVRVSMGVAFRL